MELYQINMHHVVHHLLSILNPYRLHKPVSSTSDGSLNYGDTCNRLDSPLFFDFNIGSEQGVILEELQLLCNVVEFSPESRQSPDSVGNLPTQSFDTRAQCSDWPGFV